MRVRLLVLYACGMPFVLVVAVGLEVWRNTKVLLAVPIVSFGIIPIERLLGCRVRLTAERLVVHNFLRSYAIAEADIAEMFTRTRSVPFSPSARWDQTCLRLTNGDEVVLFASTARSPQRTAMRLAEALARDDLLAAARLLAA